MYPITSTTAAVGDQHARLNGVADVDVGLLPWVDRFHVTPLVGHLQTGRGPVEVELTQRGQDAFKNLVMVERAITVAEESARAAVERADHPSLANRTSLQEGVDGRFE
jgi:hypothetical protein